MGMDAFDLHCFFAGLFIISKVWKGQKAVINFGDHPPLSPVTEVTLWQEEPKPVVLKEANVIEFPEEAGRYIYSFSGSWQQGSSAFVFQVEVDGAPPSAETTEQVGMNFSVRTDETDMKNELKPIVEKAVLDPKIPKELSEMKKPMEGIFETTIAAAIKDGKVNIDFTLRNISGKEQHIVFGSGQQYDIWVYNENKEAIYQWSNDKAFTQALIEQKLGKDGELSFHEEWNLEDNRGNPVPKGKYIMMVRVMAGLKSGTVSQDELTAQSAVRIE